MSYPPGAVERAMKVQEVILQALAGQPPRQHPSGILIRRGLSLRAARAGDARS